MAGRKEAVKRELKKAGRSIMVVSIGSAKSPLPPDKGQSEEEASHEEKEYVQGRYYKGEHGKPAPRKDDDESVGGEKPDKATPKMVTCPECDHSFAVPASDEDSKED